MKIKTITSKLQITLPSERVFISSSTVPTSGTSVSETKMSELSRDLRRASRDKVFGSVVHEQEAE